MIGLMPRAFGVICVCLCVWTGACAAETAGDSLPPEDEQVARAAAATLACPEASIGVEALDSGDEYLAIGCGKVMRFECATRAVCCPFVEPSGSLAPELMPSESPSEPMTPALTGRSKESIRARIAARIDSVRACYQTHLDSFAGPSDMWPQGKIVVTFTIAAEGSVTDAALARTSYGDPGVERCVLDVMRGLRFEAAADAGIVRVTYPFVFLTEGEQPNTCRGVPAVAPVPPGSEDVI